MRIDPNEKIAELPILDVRDFLRHVNTENEWGKHYVVSKLKISHKKAGNLIKALELNGYIEHSSVYERQKFWRKNTSRKHF